MNKPLIDKMAMALFMQLCRLEGRSKAKAREAWRGLGPEGRRRWRLLAETAEKMVRDYDRADPTALYELYKE